jgi:hypothetical protein
MFVHADDFQPSLTFADKSKATVGPSTRSRRFRLGYKSLRDRNVLAYFANEVKKVLQD